MELLSSEKVGCIVVCIVLVVAAVIDGWQLRVPNWITYPFVITGWLYHLLIHGLSGLETSLLGSFVGLGLLLLPWIIGGMGAGDVKLFAGVGTWMGPQFVLSAFVLSATVGGIMAVTMITYHTLKLRNFGIVAESVIRLQKVSSELFLERNPSRLAETAALRKSTAILLPYGIPIAIGTIGVMLWRGLL
jgi:prepilin peptidase CpaA